MRPTLLPVCGLFLAILSGGTGTAMAVDGIAVSAHYEQAELGNIHDGSQPGKLMRYDIKVDKVVFSRAIYEKDGVGAVCISPFGDRVAFTKPSGMIAVISMDGGNETELVNCLGDEKPKHVPIAGLQWPPSEGGQWIYYLDARLEGKNGILRRVNVDSKKDELVVRFNRGAMGMFALTPDATPHSGRFVKRTDNYCIAIYGLSTGDGDMFNCPRTYGCGESVSPDGSLLTANNGDHAGVRLVDMNGVIRQQFRLSQWDGDPVAGKTRDQFEWAWQGFRWSINSMNWLAVTQGKLKPGSTHEIYFADLMLYDWINQRQLNVTRNPEGKFDRAGGFWQSGNGEAFLGIFAGKAPLTVQINDQRVPADSAWDFGDGSAAASGASAGVKHIYEKSGNFVITAKQSGKVFHGEVNVIKRRPPSATACLIDATHVIVDFNEPVQANNAQVQVEGGAKVAHWQLNETGKRMTIETADAIAKDDALRITGVQDLAQSPNALPSAPIPLPIPAWPNDRKDVVFIWEDANKLNGVYDEKMNAVRELRVSRDSGVAGTDRYGRMRLEGGRLSTGFFSQSNCQEQFGRLCAGDALTIEATIQPSNLTQHRNDSPVRIINCSSWYDADWDFLIGQQNDRILVSVRTTDNMLNLEGKPVKSDLQGHAPLYEVATLPDTAPHHVALTYTPGHLVFYLDGKKSYETAEITGSLRGWGYGELCFGDNHNGGRHQWLGRIEGVAFYRRVLDEAEIHTNYERYFRKIAARKILPQRVVEARLVAISKIPDPTRIAPYHEALVVNEYEISKAISVSSDWKSSAAIEPGRKLRVAQYGIVDEIRTDLARARVGDVRRLVLEELDGNPDKPDQIVTSDSLSVDPDVPLFYEPRP